MYRKYFEYLKYVAKHKWYVYKELSKHKMYLQGIFHDLSKFRLSEFIPYARFFYNEDGSKKVKKDEVGYYKPTESGDKNFDFACSLHYKRNKHHWQYWTTAQDYRGIKIFLIPEKYIIEMICDWIGAAKAQGHDAQSVIKWYKLNRPKMQLHETSARKIAELLMIICK